MKTSFAIVFLTIFALSNARELPKNLVTCRKSDPHYSKCLDDSITSFIRSIAPGLKSLNILPVEPLVIDKIKIGDNNSPVALKQEYRNIKLYGLTNGLVVKNYSIDFDKLILYSDSMNPQVDFVADYQLDGQVLLIPVRGKGRSNITMSNVHATNTIYCEKYVKNGESYIRVKKFDVRFNPEKVILQFDSLFEGDKALGDQLQAFIRDNSELLFKELQGPYEESFGLVFANIANHIFSRYPMQTLFPE